MMRIAACQRSVIHRIQLLEAGITPAAIKHRLRTQILHVVHRAVYLVGRPTPEALGPETAAVLHFRGRAVLSDRSAAVMWRLLDPGGYEPTVTLVGSETHKARGVLVHRRGLTRADVRICRGLPVTSPARTIVDIAGALPALEVENAIAEARGRNLASNEEIDAAIKRAPYSAGIALLRRILADNHPALTRSKAERLLLRLIRAAGLPLPTANAKLLGYMVDLLWAEQRLVVEFDSYEFHGDRAAFERDRRRDQQLVAAGYRVIRITWRQVEDEPVAVIARLAAALSAIR